MSALVAIVGRPNVGKSTLFNRLVGRRVAIVEDRPGVTRDRHYADATYLDRTYTLIDTGGYVPDERDPLLKQVRQQALFAVQECDAVLFVTDVRAGWTPGDQAIADELRKSGKPVLLVANKADSGKMEDEGAGSDLFRLGLGDQLHYVSAEHGRGADDLQAALVAVLPAETEPERPAFEEDPESRPVRIAIVGRPNVGKSTLVNALLNEERMVASEVAGTTVDPVDSELEFQGRRVILTDTAGIRRKASISQTVEQFAVVGSLRTVDRSDVVVVVLDATEPAVEQDARIAGLAEEKGRALLVVVNKWDQVAGKASSNTFREQLKHELKFISYAPVVFTSAIDGTKVEKVLELALQLFGQWQYRAPTPLLNRLLKHVTEHHPMPWHAGKPLKLYYATQVAAAPPTFVFTCNRPEGVPDRYKRYLTNQLRETFDLKVPLRLIFRERPGGSKRSARLGSMVGRKQGRKLKS
ncbi:MAG: GTP-binding protein EngA [Pseudomonadota bacterium]|jgi:GTP-binding protein